MFRLDVLQNQWLILALAGGTALVLVLVLAYLAVWRGARGEAECEQPRRIPWVLIIIYVVTLVYAIIYLAMTAANPPTW
jgi:MFS superfamily sulfate permease-like transporter